MIDDTLRVFRTVCHKAVQITTAPTKRKKKQTQIVFQSGKELVVYTITIFTLILNWLNFLLFIETDRSSVNQGFILNQ